MNIVPIVLLIAPPVAAAALAFAAPRRTLLAARFNALTMPVSAGTAAWLALGLAAGGPPLAIGSVWRVDALSALFALLVSVVATLAAWLGPGLDAGDRGEPGEARTFRVYSNLFAAMMLVAVSVDNLGVMWIAIEASTVTSALLIPLRRTKAAVEASWKYLLIGSVGIALAFTGTVLAFVDYASTGADVERALNWTTLLAAAPALHAEVARLAFVFLLVGFGTKAGLVPMHTWLPDAHAEAPAPLSAVMSGVLLAVALYALARWKAIVDAALGTPFADTLLLGMGVVTVVLGCVSLVRQRQYKRLLAYSSIEHVGLACFGLALGAPGIFAALLHLSGHALAKSTAFLLGGRILARYRSHEIAGTGGALAALPATGSLFALSMLALAGLPPFGLFLSEVLLVRAAWIAGHEVLMGVVLVMMLVAFGSLVHHAQRMLLGDPPEGVTIGERLTWPVAALALPLAALAWMGASLPHALESLLVQASEVLRP
jgi:hydrogenase-4 component F